VPDPADLAASSRSLRRVAVVGAGLAGLRTAASLRDSGFRGEISMFGAEGLPPYDRPPLSKELFARPEPTWLAHELGEDVYALADRVELARPVHAIAPADVPGAAVRLDLGDGEEALADVVVLACGSHAWSPPDWDGVATLHTAADAAALRPRLTAGARLVCIGAGWIGSEISGIAAAAGVQVTVLESAEAPLTRQLGHRIGTLTVPWFAESGVDLHLGAKVTAVRHDGVYLADGRWFGADVVLAAVGARPNTGWLEGTLPLSPRHAVAVDRVGRVRDDSGFAPGSVRAVGDCADRYTERDGVVRGGHWASALHDPSLLAYDVMGGPLPAADPARYTFSTQHGHALALFGQPAPGQRVVVRGDPRGGGEWGALYVEEREGLRPGEAVLTAGLAVDAPRAVGALRRMLGGRTLPVIDVEVAADPSRSLRDAWRG